jgi:hypothetical protein
MNWKGCGRKCLCYNLRYYTWTDRRKLKKTKKKKLEYQCPRLGSSWTEARNFTFWASSLHNADRSQVSDNQVTCALGRAMSVSSRHSDLQNKNPWKKHISTYRKYQSSQLCLQHSL